jgi:hypothetical protein
MKPKIAPLQTVKSYSGEDLQLQSFITSALNKGHWSVSHPGHIFHGEGHSRPIARDLGGASETLWTVWTREKSIDHGVNTSTFSQLFSP